MGLHGHKHAEHAVPDGESHELHVHGIAAVRPLTPQDVQSCDGRPQYWGDYERNVRRQRGWRGRLIGASNSAEGAVQSGSPSTVLGLAFALAIQDGATGATLDNTGFGPPLVGPYWAQGPDFLPSAHTVLGDWIGDGQMNWLWVDGIGGIQSSSRPGHWAVRDRWRPIPRPERHGPLAANRRHPGAGAPSGYGRLPVPLPGAVHLRPHGRADPTGRSDAAETNWGRGKAFDVDGDGLTDMALIQQLTASATQATYFTNQAKDGTIAPFLRLTTGVFPVSYNINNFHAVADMDADGLEDLLELAVVGSGFDQLCITWWKNRGDGRFGDNSGNPQPELCPFFVGTGGGPAVAGLTVNPKKSNIALGDVTGDGLADLVVLVNGTLSVYVQPPSTVAASTQGFTLAGTIPNAAPDDNALVSLADVDGSGMLSVVVAENTNVSVYQLYPTVPKPGLLQYIQNPHRAQTQVTYQSVAQLAKAASPPWQTQLPAPMQVVVDVKTSGQFVGPSGDNETYETKYVYTDPTYDARDRAFVGFRVVEEDPVGSAPGAPQLNKVTTFIPGTCPGVGPAKPCSPGIDYGWRMRRGLPISVQLTDASSGSLLSTTTTSWKYQETQAGMDGRNVRMVYAAQVDSYDGEPSSPAVPGTSAPGLTSDVGTWGWSGTTTIPGSSIDRRVSHVRNLQGDETTTIAWGAVSQDQPIMTQRAWQLAPGDTTGWLYRPTQTVIGYTDATGTLTSPRTTGFVYNVLGQLVSVQVSLSGTLPLVRSNPGGSTAPYPTAASTDTPLNSPPITLASYTYDAYGNVVTVQGPDGHCSGTTYDSIFNELPVAENAYRAGCGNSPLTTGLVWDRGLQKVTQKTSPGSALTVSKYDMYGRLTEVDQPSPDAPSVTSPNPALLVDWSNADQGNVAGYTLHVTTLVHDSYLVFDNFGRERYRVDPDVTAGTWIVSGGTQLSATGRVQNAYVPFPWTGNPAVVFGVPPVTFTGNFVEHYVRRLGSAARRYRPGWRRNGKRDVSSTEDRRARRRGSRHGLPRRLVLGVRERRSRHSVGLDSDHGQRPRRSDYDHPHSSGNGRNHRPRADAQGRPRDVHAEHDLRFARQARPECGAEHEPLGHPGLELRVRRRGGPRRDERCARLRQEYGLRHARAARQRRLLTLHVRSGDLYVDRRNIFRLRYAPRQRGHSG